MGDPRETRSGRGLPNGGGLGGAQPPADGGKEPPLSAGLQKFLQGIRPIGAGDPTAREGNRELEEPGADEDLAEKKLSEAERFERQLKRGILTLLLLTTAMVAATNAWMIHRTKSFPTPFALTFTSALTSPANCRVEMAWAGEAGRRGAEGRPAVLLGGKPLPQVVRLEPGPAGQVRRLRLAVHTPPKCPSGLYAGELEVSAESSPGKDLRLAGPFPISLRVLSPWEQWHLLRKWALLMGVIGALAYCMCLFLHPAPRGTLHFRTSAADLGHSVTPVPLRAGIVGYLWPCRRSVIEVQQLLRCNPSYAPILAELPELRIEFARYGLVTLTAPRLHERGIQMCQIFDSLRPDTMSAPRGRRLGRYSLLLGAGSETWTALWTRTGADGRRAWLAFAYRRNA